MPHVNTTSSASAPRDGRFARSVDCPIDSLPRLHAATHAPSDAAAAALVLAADDLKRTIKAGKVIGFFCAAVTATVYLLTMYPSLPAGDSGDLIASSCALGAAHPPGYPTFVMLGSIFAMLPFNSVAWRVNLVSVISGTVASAALYHAAFRIALHCHYALFRRCGLPARSAPSSSRRAFEPIPCGFSSPVPVVAAFASLLYAFSPLVWFYSIQAEVFALNNAFVAVLLSCSVMFWEHRNETIAVWGAFFIGLGLTNQHTLVLYAVPLIIWAMYLLPSLLRVAVFLKMCAAGLVGLLPYAYLPLASMRMPAATWGDQSSFQGFQTHVLREEYGTFTLYSGNSTSQLSLALRMYAEDFSHQTLHLGWVLVAFGVALLWRVRIPSPSGARHSLSLLWLLAFMYMFYMIVFHSLSNLPIEQSLSRGVHARFWMQPHAITALFVGLGALHVMSLACSCLASRHSLPVRKSTLSFAAAAAAIIVARIFSAWSMCDQSDNRVFVEHGHAYLDHVPKGSVLLGTGDLMSTSIRYLQVCEGFADDVLFIDMNMMPAVWFSKMTGAHLPNITFPATVYHPYDWPHPQNKGYSMKQFIDANWRPDRPMYLCGDWFEYETQRGGVAGYKTVPFGFCRIILSNNLDIPIHQWLHVVLSTFSNVSAVYPAPVGKYAEDTWEHATTAMYWTLRQENAIWAATQCVQHLSPAASSQIAVEYCEAAAQLYESMLSESTFPASEQWAFPFFKNAGLMYHHLQSIRGDASARVSAQHRKAELWETYLALSPPGADSVAQRKELHQAVKTHREQVGFGIEGPTLQQLLVQKRYQEL